MIEKFFKKWVLIKNLNPIIYRHVEDLSKVCVHSIISDPTCKITLDMFVRGKNWTRCVAELGKDTWMKWHVRFGSLMLWHQTYPQSWSEEAILFWVSQIHDIWVWYSSIDLSSSRATRLGIRLHWDRKSRSSTTTERFTTILPCCCVTAGDMGHRSLKWGRVPLRISSLGFSYK